MKTKQQHIVFLTPGFAASETDTTNIPALQVFLKSLKKTQPETRFTILSFQFPFTKKIYSWYGMKVIPLHGKNKRYKKLWIWNKAHQTLKKIHAETPITAIHSFWIGECSTIGYRFSKKHAINHITTVMGQDAKPGNKHIKNIINTKTRVITLSENHKRILYKNHQLNTSIIPWFINTDCFPDIPKKTINILGVGALNEIKNYTLFLNIIAALVSKHPTIKVEIIGDGEKRKTLEQLIIELKLTNNVLLVGKLARKQVLLKMAEANILLHTSTYESFGFVFLEALYSKMRIVSFPVGTAKKAPNWCVCNTKEEMIIACEDFLKPSKKENKRVLLTTEEHCISSYLKLYNA